MTRSGASLVALALSLAATRAVPGAARAAENPARGTVTLFVLDGRTGHFCMTSRDAVPGAILSAPLTPETTADARTLALALADSGAVYEPAMLNAADTVYGWRCTLADACGLGVTREAALDALFAAAGGG